MPTARPFARNTGAAIAGTTQVGNLAAGTPTAGFAATGLPWWNGPDEDPGYVIATEVPANNQPTPVPPSVTASVGFWRSTAKTDASFISLAEYVARIAGSPQTFTTTLNAYVWLITNGYWTSFPPLAVTIGTQVWTTTNLNVTTYRNGDIIPQVTDQTAWNNLTTGAWCYYGNNPAYEPTIGKLYNFYAIIDGRGLAPLGFHIPTLTEWNTLSTFLGGDSVAGGKIKSNTSWDGTNESGFNALPGGFRGDFGFAGVSNFLEDTRFMCGSTSAGSSRFCGGIFNALYQGSDSAIFGVSVRLIKD